MYVGGGNIIVSSHLHSLVYVLEYLCLCFEIACVHVCVFERVLRVAQ